MFRRAVFYNVVDIAAINAYILWKQLNPGYHQNKTHKRRLFIEELGLALASTPLQIIVTLEPRIDKNNNKRDCCKHCSHQQDKKNTN